MQQKHLAIIASGLVAAAIIGSMVLLTTAPRPAPNVNTAPVEPGPEPEPMPTAYKDLIRVTSPRPNAVVTSPITITGEARGNWYFEATFPVKLLDANGNELASHYATAQGDWMTTEYVPFTASLEYERQPATATGTLVLSKSNASGLPEHDDEVRVPVRFGTPQAGQPWRACKRSGCSGQICSDEDVASDCMYRPEYACFGGATCERQVDGECGWTMTAALQACLQDPPRVE